MAGKLTATGVDKYRPVRNDEILSDGNGLSIRYRRLAGSLSRAWMYTYRIRATSHYLTLGEHLDALSPFQVQLYALVGETSLSLATARKMALHITSWRKQGIDPKQFIESERRRFEAANSPTPAHTSTPQQVPSRDETVFLEGRGSTFTDMSRAWLTDGVRRKDGNVALERLLRMDVFPSIGAIPVKDLTEHHLRAMLRKIVARGADRTAVVVRNTVSQMFTWAKKRQPWRGLMVSGDPMELIEIEKIVTPGYDFSNQRDRILKADEIRELAAIFCRIRSEYDAAPNKRVIQQPIERTTELAVWIMLSTLCRVGEMSMARWAHVDLAQGTWHIPKENIKGNMADFQVFLSPFAVEQFRQLYTTTCYSEWCFPARSNQRHLNVNAIAKQIADRQSQFKHSKTGAARDPMANRPYNNILVLGGGKNGAWTPHDLRRSGATLMQSLGISLEVIDRCQNHVLPGSRVRRHYLHHDYANEKRAAWSRLGDQLQKILEVSADEETQKPQREFDFG